MDSSPEPKRKISPPKRRPVITTKSRSPNARKMPKNAGSAGQSIAGKKFDKQAAAVLSSYPEHRQTAHQQFVGQVEPNDLQAQVYVKQVQGRERELRQQRIAEMGGIPADSQAAEQQRILMEMQAMGADPNAIAQMMEGGEGAPGIAMNNYMVMQNRQQGLLPQGGPLGALR